MHGLLSFLLSDDPQAVALRDRALIKLVPMLNPDGVFLGNYRCSSLGVDLNRHWQNSSPWVSPTILAVRTLMGAYANDPRWVPAICVDMHAHSTALNGFLFCNSHDDPDAFEREAAFPRALSAAARDLPFSGSKFCADPAKAGTGRRALSDLLGGAHCYTMEVSFFASGDPGAPVPYTQARYVDLGRKVGNALCAYFDDAPGEQRSLRRGPLAGQGATAGAVSAPSAPPTRKNSPGPRTRSASVSLGSPAAAAAGNAKVALGTNPVPPVPPAPKRANTFHGRIPSARANAGYSPSVVRASITSKPPLPGPTEIQAIAGVRLGGAGPFARSGAPLTTARRKTSATGTLAGGAGAASALPPRGSSVRASLGGTQRR
mmetsp:Transcript_9599/g.28410  ORF Transcript_9599/g.28410 Transcript_9599/m.28410 type:complete len:374 (+) Transcript_9599:1011-2132(+)